MNREEANKDELIFIKGVGYFHPDLLGIKMGDTGKCVEKDNNVPVKQPDPITGLVPCDFCTDTFDQKPLLQENKYKPYTCMMSTISIEENNGKHQIEIDLWDGGNVYAAFEINYCPMCGRKLTAPPRPGAMEEEK